MARAAPAPVPGLPASFAWSSSAPVIVPRSDASHDLVAVKDPTVVRYKDRWHVFASSVARGGIYGMVYTSFADWSDAPRAPLYYMDNTRGFKTYVAAPQVFYFTPQKKWYLIYQSGPPMFSTADDVGDPTKWTEPSSFFAKTPADRRQERRLAGLLGDSATPSSVTCSSPTTKAAGTRARRPSTSSRTG